MAAGVTSLCATVTEKKLRYKRARLTMTRCRLTRANDNMAQHVLDDIET